jgi:Predicted AAA-ATPase
VSLPIPTGIDDFRAVREQGLAYVDKSDMIRELLDASGVQVVLLPRPRRFGKTMNLSRLFADLSIWQAGAAYRAHFQRYPVISLTLKEVKLETFDETWSLLRAKIAALFAEHRALLDGGILREEEAQRYRQVLAGTADVAAHANALLDLSMYLHRAHGEKVVILVDEYDAPIHASYAGGYAPRILDFFRAFVSAGLKGNPHLYRAVVTGVLRVSKESLFSGANNIGVYTLLARQYETCFGFTEPEVVALLERAGRPDALAAGSRAIVQLSSLLPQISKRRLPGRFRQQETRRHRGGADLHYRKSEPFSPGEIATTYSSEGHSNQCFFTLPVGTNKKTFLFFGTLLGRRCAQP